MRVERIPIGCLVVAILAVLAAGLLPAARAAVAADAPEHPLVRRVTFLPQWRPQAQFAGYYAALARGFYAARGLDAVILDGGPDRPPSSWMAAGEADIGSFFLASAMRLASQGLDLVNLGQLVQRSTLMLVARKDEVRTLADLNGTSVSLWGADFAVQPRALFASKGIRVRELPQSDTVNLFLRGGVTAASAMWYNEYHAIIDSGLDPDELTTIAFKDTEFDFPEDGIYCLRSFYEEHPDLCRDFVAATLEGWRYAFDHPDEALALVLERRRALGLPANLPRQRWMLARMRDVLDPDAAGFGRLQREDYARVARVLRETGTVTAPPEYTEFVRDVLP